MESPARPASSSGAGPRVYVPITHPHSPIPTYAVLQFVGLAGSPGNITLPFPAASNSSGSSHSSIDGSSTAHDDTKVMTKLTSVKPSPMKKSSSTCAARSPTARRPSGKNLPPTASISITHTEKDTIIHAHSSNFREVVHQLTGASSRGKHLMPVSTSVGQNGEKNLMIPASAPARTISGYGNVKQESPLPSTRGPIGNTTKLLERRKSSKVLDRLTTSCRDLPPLVPSPVTPLASDFEKICLPLTPSPSQGNSPVVSVVTASMPSYDGEAVGVFPIGRAIPSHAIKARDVSLEDGMDVQASSVLPHAEVIRASSVPNAMDVQATQSSQQEMVVQASSPHQVPGVLGLSISQSEGSSWVTSDSNMSHDGEESIIVRKGFSSFTLDRLRWTNPTLLPLFPESPSKLQ